jgi:DNA-binding IclR family transcriptional regulator
LILANLNGDEQSAFFQSDQDYQALDESEQRALLIQLQKIRDTGYSTSENESHVGVRDVAVLVGNPQISAIAALALTSLTVKRDRKSLLQVLEALTACSNQITSNMGLTVKMPSSILL